MIDDFEEYIRQSEPSQKEKSQMINIEDMNTFYRLVILAILLAASLDGMLYAQSLKEIKKEIEGKCIIDDNGNVTYQTVMEYPGKSKDEIYDILQVYLVYAYQDANSVIQVEDKKIGTLVGKGIYKNLIYDMGVWHILRIDIKEERIRIITSLTDFFTPTAGVLSKKKPLIGDICPLNPAAEKKAYYTKLFYLAHQQVLTQFETIDRSIKKTNTSTTIENNDW